MNVSNQLLFFFSALGVFNALLISFYFFFYKKPKHISNYFFGFLLLAMVIRVGKSVFYYFNNELSQVFLQVGISACLFIGPFLYFYIKSVVHPDQLSRYRWKLHIVVLGIAIIWVGIQYPWTEHPRVWQKIVLPATYWIWFAYIIAAGWELLGIGKKLIKKSSSIGGLEFWLLSVFVGNVFIWVAYKTVAYTSYIVGALSFSFIFYLLVLLIIFNRKKVAFFHPSEKYADKKIASDEVIVLQQKLESIMRSEKLYTDANLKLPHLAKKLHILPHKLSQLLNDNLDKSFTQFINEYRIEAAKSMLETNSQLTLEAIGYECGFNSKSTFYAAFKKNTGTTPAQFKASLS